MAVTKAKAVATRKTKDQDFEEKIVSLETKSKQTTNNKGEVKMAEETKAAEKVEAQVSGKSKLVALLLCFFLGWAGGHRFYVGKVGTGLMMMFTMGGFGMWYFLDFIMISTGNFKDNANLPLSTWK